MKMDIYKYAPKMIPSRAQIAPDILSETLFSIGCAPRNRFSKNYCRWVFHNILYKQKQLMEGHA